MARFVFYYITNSNFIKALAWDFIYQFSLKFHLSIFTFIFQLQHPAIFLIPDQYPFPLERKSILSNPVFRYPFCNENRLILFLGDLP